MSADDLTSVPAKKIIGIQLCDVGERAMDPLRHESLHHPCHRGRGFGDVVGMLRAKGVEAMVSVEVISDHLLSRGLHVAAQTVMAAATEVLDAARPPETYPTA
jgi:hypothetical protein